MDDCGDYSDEANCGKKPEDPPPSASLPVTQMGDAGVPVTGAFAFRFISRTCCRLSSPHWRNRVKRETGIQSVLRECSLHFLCTVAGSQPTYERSWARDNGVLVAFLVAECTRKHSLGRNVYFGTWCKGAACHSKAVLTTRDLRQPHS